MSHSNAHRKKRFMDRYSKLSEQDYKLELLYSQQMTRNKLENIRAKLKTIIWSISILILVAILCTALIIYYN